MSSPGLESLPFALLWGGWGTYWLARSGGGKANTWREPWLSRMLHIVPLVLGASLLTFEIPALGLDGRFLPLSWVLYGAGVFLTAAGLAFTVWARLHLGRNWSGTVTLKEGHELITTGPYAFVRHPIYTGLLVAFCGGALSVGEWRAVLALGVVTAALWRKWRVEERGMRRLFGQAYDSYARRVPAVIPFLR